MDEPIILLGRDGLPLPPVPERDPVCLVAFSVRPRSRTRAEVHVVIGNRFVFADTIRDVNLEKFVQSFASVHPVYRGREPELLALLRQRWAIEVSHYLASRTARRGVHP